MHSANKNSSKKAFFLIIACENAKMLEAIMIFLL